MNTTTRQNSPKHSQGSDYQKTQTNYNVTIIAINVNCLDLVEGRQLVSDKQHSLLFTAIRHYCKLYLTSKPVTCASQ